MPKLSANYLTVNPDGTVGAQFTGGLILPVPVGAGATSTTSVTWTRSEDGGQVAQIRVERTLAAPARNTMYQRIVSPNGAESAEIDLLAMDAPFAPGGEKSSVQAFASAAVATILDSKGQSSFLQLAGAAKAFTLWGPFTTAVTAAIPQNNDAAVDVVHNGNIPNLKAFPVGGLIDGNFAGLCGWRWNWKDANTLTIHIGNPSVGVAGVAAAWTGFIIQVP